MTAEDIALRLSAALVVGLAFGYERERHGRAAGLKTMCLVSVAAALAGMLPLELIGEGETDALWRPDPLRLGAGLFAGIGFLGAGTIIRQGPLVWGVTTAALLWFVTMSGLCFGCGEYALGASGSAIAFAAVRLLPAVERRLPYDRYATLTIVTEGAALTNGILREMLAAHALHVRSTSLGTVQADRSWKQVMRVRYRQPASLPLADTIVARLAGLPGVKAVEWSEEG